MHREAVDKDCCEQSFYLECEYMYVPFDRATNKLHRTCPLDSQTSLLIMSLGTFGFLSLRNLTTGSCND